MNRCLMLVLALLCLGLPGFAAASEAACRAAQLKAAANFCGQALGCESRYVRRSAQDPSGSRREGCLTAATERLRLAYEQALGKERTRGGQCKLSAPSVDVAARWRVGVAGDGGLVPTLLRGWEAGNAVGDLLYAGMLQNTGAACKSLLDAHAASAKRNQAAPKGKLNRIQGTLGRKLDQARAKAARKGYVHGGTDGASIAAAAGRYTQALAAETAGDLPPPPDGGVNGGLQGKLYFQMAGAQELDLASGIRRLIRTDLRAEGELHASWDGRELSGMEFVVEHGDLSRYLVIFGLDGVASARYTLTGASFDFPKGPVKFSPDGQFLVYKSKSCCPETYTAFRRDNVNSQINYRDSGNSLESAAWLPDGRLLLAVGKSLVVSGGAEEALPTLAVLPDGPSDLEVNRDGSRIVFRMNGHLWTLNGDGGGLRQATDSSCTEYDPAFSPDGNFLILKYCPDSGVGDIWVTPAGGERVWIGSGKPTAAFRIRYLDAGGNVNNAQAASSISWR